MIGQGAKIVISWRGKLPWCWGRESFHQEALVVSRHLFLQESCQVATNSRGLLLVRRSRKLWTIITKLNSLHFLKPQGKNPTIFVQGLFSLSQIIKYFYIMNLYIHVYCWFISICLFSPPSFFYQVPNLFVKQVFLFLPKI
jgi:hypothetical protein